MVISIVSCLYQPLPASVPDSLPASLYLFASVYKTPKTTAWTTTAVLDVRPEKKIFLPTGGKVRTIPGERTMKRTKRTII
jgi:hypothetical protein